jgi:hypothetical protein
MRDAKSLVSASGLTSVSCWLLMMSMNRKTTNYGSNAYTSDTSPTFMLLHGFFPWVEQDHILCPS